MYKQLSLVDLVAAIRNRINNNSNITCYDCVEDNLPAPFCFAEVVRVSPADTKTMYVKSYEVCVHVIAEAGNTSVPIYGHIKDVQEAMSEDIELPCYVHLVSQTDAGVQTILTDETGEKHAILDYVFSIAYGYKIKQ